MNYEIKIFPNLDPELKEYWENLENSADCYCFQSYDWFENWLKIYREGNDKFSLCVVMILSNSKPICILPFEVEKKSYIKILKWAGGDKSDYFSPILYKNLSLNKEEFIYIWKEIIRKVPKTDLIYLNKNNQIIKNVNPQNIFRHSSIGKNKKSVTFKLIFQHPLKTLEDKDVNLVIDEIIKVVSKDFSAKLR